MHRHLFFTCPTDHLEGVINSLFKEENYFVTSLGNSITFDRSTVLEINELLDAKKINYISFVLEQNNRIVSEAMEMKLDEIHTLSDFQKKIRIKKKYTQEMWHSSHYRFLTLSCHLNEKIRELKQHLNYMRASIPPIKGIIYDQDAKSFTDVYSNLIYENNVSVN